VTTFAPGRSGPAVSSHSTPASPSKPLTEDTWSLVVYPFRKDTGRAAWRVLRGGKTVSSGRSLTELDAWDDARAELWIRSNSHDGHQSLVGAGVTYSLPKGMIEAAAPDPERAAETMLYKPVPPHTASDF